MKPNCYSLVLLELKDNSSITKFIGIRFTKKMEIIGKFPEVQVDIHSKELLVQLREFIGNSSLVVYNREVFVLLNNYFAKNNIKEVDITYSIYLEWLMYEKNPYESDFSLENLCRLGNAPIDHGWSTLTIMADNVFIAMTNYLASFFMNA